MSEIIPYKIQQIVDNGKVVQMSLAEDVELEQVSQKQLIMEAVAKKLDPETKEQVTPLLEAILQSQPTIKMKSYEQLIQKLEQRISELENRLQTLLDKVETGEYYGPVVGTESTTKSYSISFDGVASSIYDESITTEVSGAVFLETLGSLKDTSKFRVTGGEIFVGENIYDIVKV